MRLKAIKTLFVCLICFALYALSFALNWLGAVFCALFLPANNLGDRRAWVDRMTCLTLPQWYFNLRDTATPPGRPDRAKAASPVLTA